MYANFIPLDSTRLSTNSLSSIRDTLTILLNQTTALAACPAQTLDEFLNQFLEQESKFMGVETTPMAPTAVIVGGTTSTTAVDVYESQTAEILRNSDNMSEDEKKTLWASLFPGTVPERESLNGGADEDNQQDQQQKLG